VGRVINSQRLGSLFRPRSVAVVGASDKSTWSQSVYKYLVEFGFTDRTYLVNKRGVDVHGRPTFTSCAKIGVPVDLAFVMVPQAVVLEALSDAAAAGIRNVVILSSGYGEAGSAGREAQTALVAHAEALDMVILGPNHLGFANLVDQVPATTMPGLPRKSGPVALLSQSGAVCVGMLEFAAQHGVDLSYLVTLGNESMITAGHVLDFLVDDPQTRSVAIYMEAIREAEVFRAAARRAANAGKAVVVLKVGSSQRSMRSAAAHTGALAGDDATLNAVFRDLGVIRVSTVEDMLLTARAAAYLGPISRSGIAVVSDSGGACGVFADRAQEVDAEIPDFSAETTQMLAKILPSFGTAQNPLDVTGAIVMDPPIWRRCLETVAHDPAIGVVAAISSYAWNGTGLRSLEWFLERTGGAGVSPGGAPIVYVNQVMQPIKEHTRDLLADHGVKVVVSGLEHGARVLRNIAWWSGALHSAREAHAQPTLPQQLKPPRERRKGTWSEYAARNLLAEAGIPVIPADVANSADEAVAVAAKLGVAVAMKIVSPDILHKSDIGGVRLQVAGEQAVRQSYQDLIAAGAKVSSAKIDGVLISPMRSGGIEMMVGVVRDPDWGLVMAVAFGGVLVEVLQDSVLSPLPVGEVRAQSMLQQLRGADLLEGVRGGPPADVVQLAQVIARVSRLAELLGEDLESLEINPLRVDGSTLEALDAVVTWRPGA
jgi:acetate---CoA ligase (ADP-forming)